MKGFYALALTLLTTVAATAAEPGFSILCYHHFEEKPLQGYSVKPADFEQQMAYLEEHGYNVLKLSEIIDRLEGRDKSPFPDKAVAITIDDGYRCAYEKALPILRKHKFPATLFIYPQYVGAKGDKCSWDEYKSLEAEGLFDVQCHSYTHPNFAKMARTLPPEKYSKEMHHEIFDSKKTLETKLGKKIEHIAWPHGVYDRQIQQWAIEAGYKAMYSVDGGPNSATVKPTSVSRAMVMHADGIKAFARKATPLPLELKIVSPADGAILENGPYEVVAEITDSEVKLETVRGVSASCSGGVDRESRKLRLRSPGAIKPGVHIITVTGSDSNGKGTKTATWLFRSK